MQRPITLAEIRSIAEYEKVRGDMRNRVIALKKYRRVAVGDDITVVFENRETMLFQIHEMMRAEGITAANALQAECDVYNQLLPTQGELSATLFIELREGANIREELHKLVGIDEHTTLTLGPQTIPARFESGRTTEEKIATVQFVRFVLDEPARRTLEDLSIPTKLVIKHPNYQAEGLLSAETRRSLAEDLR